MFNLLKMLNMPYARKSVMPIIFIVIFSLMFILFNVAFITAIVKTVKQSKMESSKISNVVKKSLYGLDNKETKICEYCGSSNDENEDKCKNCGAPLNRKK